MSKIFDVGKDECPAGKVCYDAKFVECLEERDGRRRRGEKETESVAGNSREMFCEFTASRGAEP